MINKINSLKFYDKIIRFIKTKLNLIKNFLLQLQKITLTLKVKGEHFDTSKHNETIQDKYLK